MDDRTRTAPGAGAARPAEPLISIVVPAMNEARNLEIVLPQLPQVHEVILVDGNSTDDTVDTARRILPDVRVLPQTRRGKGNALAVGFEAATGDIIVMFDADGSADPREIPAFVEALVAGADFAKGSRNLAAGGSEDITGIRNAGNLALLTTANLLLGTQYTDLCYGYNAFWTDVLEHLALPPAAAPPDGANSRGMLWGDGFEIETLINCRVAKAKLNVVEVPSVELPRIHGESNLNARRDGIRVLRTLVTEWRNRQVPALRPSPFPVGRIPEPRLPLGTHAGAELSHAQARAAQESAAMIPHPRPHGATESGGAGHIFDIRSHHGWQELPIQTAMED